MEGNIISLIFSILSFVVSVLAVVIVWRYNNVSIRNGSRQDHNKIMLEINQLLIENPDLWVIYDNHPLKEEVSHDPLNKAKRDAFIYHYINFFDILFDFYNRQISKNRNDKEDWKAWSSFMEHFFRGSSEARKIFKKSSTWYDAAFSKFIEDIIVKIEQEAAFQQSNHREDSNEQIQSTAS